MIDLGAGEEDVRLLGNEAGDGAGYSVASGDLNGDGFDDLIIGAPLSAPGGRVEAGKTYVVLGGTELPAATELEDRAALILLGGESIDRLGNSVASGDLNGDGFDDLIIGSSAASAPDRFGAGKTYVIYGESNLSAVVNLNVDAADVTFVGKRTDDQSGSSLACGDIDGDDLNDLIIGAPGAPNGTALGEAYVIKGSRFLSFPPAAVEFLDDADLSLQGFAAADRFGNSVASGDFNWDGHDDLLIGATNARSYTGNAYVVLGDPLLTGSIDLTILGDDPSGSAGWVVTTSNFDGDGFDDLITSAPGASPPSAAFGGKVYTIYGNPSFPATTDLSSSESTLVIWGGSPNDLTGISVASGDFNGDAVDDLIVGASQASPGGKTGAGEVYLVYGIPPFVGLSMPDTSSLYNQALTVPVRIDTTNGLKMIMGKMHISFDSDLLTLIDIDQTGTLLNDWSVGTSLAEGAASPIDTLKIEMDGPVLRATGEFLRLDFTLKDVRQAMIAPLTFEHVTFNQGRPEWNQGTPGSVTVLGHDGIVVSTIISEPGDTVQVQVTDVDLDADPGSLETIWVTLRNSVTDDLETIPLSEQEVGDGVFFGRVRTTLGDQVGEDGDGVINTQTGDLLLVTYTDPLSALGPVTDVVATHQVVILGDVDGNGERQAFDAARILGHAIGHITLTALDSLKANLDLEAPYSPITSFDAALLIQRRLGTIDHFPVQETDSANHPQPGDSSPKPVPQERLLTLIPQGTRIVVWAEERDEIVAGDLVIEGLEGAVEMAPELADFQAAFRSDADDLHVVFAGGRAASGPGELFRIALTGTGQVRGLRGHFNGGRIAVRSEVQNMTIRPLRLALHPNAPNPFNAQTLIRFDLPTAQKTRLEIFNALGQKVRTLTAGQLEAGAHQVHWDSRDDRGLEMASGHYFYRLTAGKSVQTQSMLLLK